MKEKYTKFNRDIHTLTEGDIFYQLDDLGDLPPMKLEVTRWGAKCFLDNDDVIECKQTFPQEAYDKWKLKYGTTEKKWKRFLKEIKTTTWSHIDFMYIKKRTNG